MPDIEQEFEGLLQGQETPPAEGPSDDKLFEFAVGDQQYKLPLTAELPIKHNGQIIKAPLETVLNAYRQQAHLQDKYSAFKREREEFDAQRKEFGDIETLKEKYGLIQKYSEENPDEWNRLWEIFQNRDQHLLQNDNSDQLHKVIGELRQKIEGLETFKTTFEKEQEEKSLQSAHQEIDAEIKQFEEGIGKKYGIDLSVVDEDGLTLRDRIMQHGAEHKPYPITKFELAALSYLGPKAFEAAEQYGKTSTSRTIQEGNKQGIVRRVPVTPDKVDVSKLSDEERHDAALAELQNALGG